MTVSLCMIVRNEEVNLDACLASAVGLTDDIVVVDTGSTDETKAVAQWRGARVFDFPWCDDFAAARNESVRHATGDWILWLDADDRIDGENHAKLKALLSSLPDTHDGYYMRCVSLSAGDLASYQSDHVRLFRAGPQVRFSYRVHEQIAPAVRRNGGELRSTDIVIRHEGYRDLEVYRAKQERNLRLLELACLENPLDPFMLYYRGVALLDVNRAAEALVSLTLASDLVPPHTAIARLLPVQLAHAYEAEGFYAEAADTLRVAREIYSADAGIAFAESTLFYSRGEIERAEGALSAYLSLADGIVRPENYSGDPSIEGFRARCLRGALYYLMGLYDEAEQDARLVIAAQPRYGQGWLLLGDALLARHREDELEGVMRELETGEGGDILSTLLRASRSSREGDRPRALEQVEAALLSHPGDAFLERARDRLARAQSHGPLCAAYFLSSEALPRLRSEESEEAPLTRDRSEMGVALRMIVRNESHNLADCIRGLLPLVREVHIVDTGSTDDTRELPSGRAEGSQR
jgi:glycosyltransferase involved in cell wall biosynthesis